VRIYWHPIQHHTAPIRHDLTRASVWTGDVLSLIWRNRLLGTAAGATVTLATWWLILVPATTATIILHAYVQHTSPCKYRAGSDIPQNLNLIAGQPGSACLFPYCCVSASISTVLCLLLTYCFLGCSLLLCVCLAPLLCYVYCLPCVFVVSYCLRVCLAYGLQRKQGAK